MDLFGLRGPRTTGRRGFYYGDDGPERSDLTTQAISQLLAERRTRNFLQGEEDAENKRIRRGQMIQSMKDATGLDMQGRPKNVVYNQGPELAAQKLKADVANEQAKIAVEGRKADALANIRGEELDIKRGNQDIASRRADIADFNSRNPNMQIRATQGGNFIAINPRTGEVVDTGAGTGTMSQMDKLSEQQKNFLARLGVSAENAQALERLRQEGDMAQIEARGEQARTTQAERPMAPTQRSTQLNERVREIYNRNPGWQKYIQLDDKGFIIQRPSTGGMFSSGPDEATWKAINDAIYNPQAGGPQLGGGGFTKGMPQTGSGQHPSVSNQSSAPPNVTGAGANMVRMQLPDGRVKLIPNSQVEEATKRGAKRVQ